jgi:hypothetical protein
VHGSTRPTLATADSSTGHAVSDRRKEVLPHFAFDAFYIYEYFDQPLTQVPDRYRAGFRCRAVLGTRVPLCQADLTMPLRYTFRNKTTRVEHERSRYVCPLLWPEKSADPCPIEHKQRAKGGCTTTIATSVGARLRYQLDRDSQAYTMSTSSVPPPNALRGLDSVLTRLRLIVTAP